MDSIETEAVVIGAGLAGLSAARELERLGVDRAETMTLRDVLVDGRLGSGLHIAQEVGRSPQR